MSDGILGLMRGRIIDLGKLELKTLNRLRYTLSSILGFSRHILTKEEFLFLSTQLERYDIGYVFLIGGNGTMEICRQIDQHCKKNNYQNKPPLSASHFIQ